MGAKGEPMAAKKSYQRWDSVDSVDSRTLAAWGAFRSVNVTTIDLDDHHAETATFAMRAALGHDLVAPLLDHCQACLRSRVASTRVRGRSGFQNSLPFSRSSR